MCLICVDFQREKMSPLEARRALGEMREKIGPQHAREVEQMVEDREVELRKDTPTDDQPCDAS